MTITTPLPAALIGMALLASGCASAPGAADMGTKAATPAKERSKASSTRKPAAK